MLTVANVSFIYTSQTADASGPNVMRPPIDYIWDDVAVQVSIFSMATLSLYDRM